MDSTGGACEGILRRVRSSFVGRWCFRAMTALPAETPLPLLLLPSKVKRQRWKLHSTTNVPEKEQVHLQCAAVRTHADLQDEGNLIYLCFDWGFIIMLNHTHSNVRWFHLHFLMETEWKQTLEQRWCEKSISEVGYSVPSAPPPALLSPLMSSLSGLAWLIL